MASARSITVRRAAYDDASSKRLKSFECEFVYEGRVARVHVVLDHGAAVEQTAHETIRLELQTLVDAMDIAAASSQAIRIAE